MSALNPIITTPEEQFVVGESDFSFFANYSGRCDNAVVLFCRSGSASIAVEQARCLMQRNTLAFVLPGWALSITDRSSDFRVSYCAFSRELFSEAAFRIDPSFFHTLHAQPFSNSPVRIAEGAAIWFQMAAYTYRDRGNLYRNTIIKNRLQNVMLEIYDKLQRFSARKNRTPENTTRQTELFQRFVGLVHENCSHEREVAFYADRLCISTRYLSTIVRHVAHSSAKEFIDQAVVLEIKMLLQSTDLSVQEIAYRLHFPDQSYLGRYFKKHTGEAPTEYRNTKQ